MRGMEGGIGVRIGLLLHVGSHHVGMDRGVLRVGGRVEQAVGRLGGEWRVEGRGDKVPEHDGTIGWQSEERKSVE